MNKIRFWGYWIDYDRVQQGTECRTTQYSSDLASLEGIAAQKARFCSDLAALGTETSGGSRPRELLLKMEDSNGRRKRNDLILWFVLQ